MSFKSSFVLSDNAEREPQTQSSKGMTCFWIELQPIFSPLKRNARLLTYNIDSFNKATMFIKTILKPV